MFAAAASPPRPPSSPSGWACPPPTWSGPCTCDRTHDGQASADLTQFTRVDQHVAGHPEDGHQRHVPRRRRQVCSPAISPSSVPIRRRFNVKTILPTAPFSSVLRRRPARSPSSLLADQVSAGAAERDRRRSTGAWLQRSHGGDDSRTVDSPTRAASAICVGTHRQGECRDNCDEEWQHADEDVLDQRILPRAASCFRRRRDEIHADRRGDDGGLDEERRRHRTRRATCNALSTGRKIGIVVTTIESSSMNVPSTR